MQVAQFQKHILLWMPSSKNSLNTLVSFDLYYLIRSSLYDASYWKQMGFPATLNFMLMPILLKREKLMKGHKLQY
jgi:hypothetical protein